MSYNPEIPTNRYDNCGDSEWTRLERDAHGELLYHVHLDILKRYIKPSDCVFEIGAGSGRYTKDMNMNTGIIHFYWRERKWL